MTNVVLYSSKTGNTRKIAEAIYEVLPKNKVLVSVDEKYKVSKNDIVFIGFWIDKGNCDELSIQFSKKIKNCKVVLFGTMGSSDNIHFGSLMKTKAISLFSKHNEVVDCFLCQGKIVSELKEKHLQKLIENPNDEEAKQQIINHDLSQSHPDINDVNNAKSFALNIIHQLQSTV